MSEGKRWGIVGLVIFSIIGFGLWFFPVWGVWQQRLQGQAILAHAQSSREVAVAEAKAKMESASLLAQAEIERAKGVAKANEIIGEGLRGHEEYLRYLWIMALEHVAASPNGSTVVYVPTETNLPILEATRNTVK